MTPTTDTSVKLGSLSAPDSEISFTFGGHDDVGVAAI